MTTCPASPGTLVAYPLTGVPRARLKQQETSTVSARSFKLEQRIALMSAGRTRTAERLQILISGESLLRAPQPTSFKHLTTVVSGVTVLPTLRRHPPVTIL